jgi:hypothetical protein
MEHRHAVTITPAPDVQMLRNLITAEPSGGGNELSNIWLQTARASTEVLQDIFPAKFISQRGELPWPPCSPDLSACDCFLCWFLKTKIYTSRSRIVDYFRIAIRKQMPAISESTGNLPASLKECILIDRQQFSDVVF